MNRGICASVLLRFEPSSVRPTTAAEMLELTKRECIPINTRLYVCMGFSVVLANICTALRFVNNQHMTPNHISCTVNLRKQYMLRAAAVYTPMHSAAPFRPPESSWGKPRTRSSKLREAHDAPEGYVSGSRGEGMNQVYHLDTDEEEEEEEEVTEESEEEDAGCWDDEPRHNGASDSARNESADIDAQDSMNFLPKTDTADGQAREGGMLSAVVDGIQTLTSISTTTTTTASPPGKKRGILSKGKRLHTGRQQEGSLHQVEEDQQESRRIQRNGEGEAKRVSWEPNEDGCASDERDETVELEIDSMGMGRALCRNDEESAERATTGQQDEKCEHEGSTKVCFDMSTRAVR
jgi:hypothetical protein